MDREYERERGRDETKPPNPQNMAMREMTVREYLDQAIDGLGRQIVGLRELRQSLSQDYLDRGCSSLAQALRLGGK